MEKAICEKISLVFAALSWISVYGAPPTPLGRRNFTEFEIRKELKRLNKPAIKSSKNSATPGNWWLSINNVPVGYWPGSLFKSMNGKAQYIQWGGQVYRPTSGETHSSTQMSSGHYPPKDGKKWFPTPYPYTSKISKSGCYDMSDVSTVEGAPGISFFYRGPGGPNCDA